MILSSERFFQALGLHSCDTLRYTRPSMVYTFPTYKTNFRYNKALNLHPLGISTEHKKLLPTLKLYDNSIGVGNDRNTLKKKSCSPKPIAKSHIQNRKPSSTSTGLENYCNVAEFQSYTSNGVGGGGGDPWRRVRCTTPSLHSLSGRWMITVHILHRVLHNKKY